MLRRLPLLIALLALAGCSLYEIQARRAGKKLARAGLVHTEATLGPHQVVYWEGQGDGTPLLLLHGFGGNAAFTWVEQADLVEGRRVIAPDLLWFGDSSSEATPSLSAQSDAILALLDHEGVEVADVVGISYGGLVTLDLATAHPERFRRVVLVDSPGPVYTREDHDAALARYGVASLSELVIPEGPEGVRGLVELAFHDPPATPGFVLADVYRNGFTDHTDEKRALVADLERRIGTRPDWSLSHPVLVMWGEHDPLFPVVIGERLVDAIGDHARMELITEANHAPNIEQPEQFDAALSAFLDAPDPEPEPAPEPAWAFEAGPLSDGLRAAMTGVSWHEGCPVGLDDLVLVTVSHWGFDGAVHTGRLVVAEAAVPAVEAGFRAAFEAGFPIERMEPVHQFDGSDDASMAANNTSAFNCREVSGGSGWSRHSYGDAIDVNPLQNPYVRGDRVLPPEGAAHLARDPSVTGLITADAALVTGFAAHGWGWGGTWTSFKDYQHFSATGR